MPTDDFGGYINNLTCSDEIKTGEHDMEKVATIIGTRLSLISQDAKKFIVSSHKDVTRVNWTKKPNFLITKLFEHKRK